MCLNESRLSAQAFTCLRSYTFVYVRMIDQLRITQTVISTDYEL